MIRNAFAKEARQGARGSFVQSKDLIFSTLFVVSLGMSRPVKKNKFTTKLRELRDTPETYVRLYYLLKNSCYSTNLDYLFVNQSVLLQSMPGEMFYY